MKKLSEIIRNRGGRRLSSSMPVSIEHLIDFYQVGDFQAAESAAKVEISRG